MLNYLQLVNKVLVRLREDQVSTVNQTDYSSLIGEYINETKREVEDSWNWNILNQLKVITTSNGVETYPLQGGGDRLSIHWAIDEQRSFLPQISSYEYFTLAPTDGRPDKYAIYGADVNGDPNVLLYPTPDGVYTYKFNVKIPQGFLVSDTDTLLVSWMPVMLGAYAKAVGERGEDGGVSVAEATAMYQQALKDAIALEAQRYPEHTVWSVV